MAETKEKTNEAKTVDFVKQLGKAVTLKDFSKDFKGREEEAFAAFAAAAGHGYFVNPNGVTLAMPKTGDARSKINDALNNL